MTITFRQVEFFLAVADTLSFSRAAQICHISQPALSMNIRKLEEALGARLFDRHTRNVSLTAVGQAFYGMAQMLVDNMLQAQGNIQDFVRGKRGKLVIASGPSIASYFAPQAVSCFLGRHPDVEVRLHDELSDICIDMLRSGKADIALIPSPGETDDLLLTELFRDHLVAIFPADHELAQREVVHWRDLQGFPHIQVKTTSSLRQIVEAQMSRAGRPFRPAHEVAHAATMLGLIDAGLGVGVLSEASLKHANMGGLSYRRIVSRSAYRTICAVWLKHRSPVPTLHAFVEVCKQIAGAVQPVV
ncbi:MAG: LysR family transcriptional regulator [Pseudomonadales bacterium]